MSKRTASKTPRQIWIEGFLSAECCGVAPSSGYDVMTVACRHNDYANVTENAYYNMCNGCGNIDILCAQCVTEAVAETNS